MSADTLADWVERHDHYGNIQPLTDDDIHWLRRPVTTEWTETTAPAFPPVCRPSAKRYASRAAHLHAWLAELRKTHTNADLIRYVQYQLGIEERQDQPAHGESTCRATLTDQGETIEWEPGDYIPPGPHSYAPAAAHMPKQVDSMHWLAILNHLCGLDDDLTNRYGTLRATFWRG